LSAAHVSKPTLTTPLSRQCYLVRTLPTNRAECMNRFTRVYAAVSYFTLKAFGADPFKKPAAPAGASHCRNTHLYQDVIKDTFGASGNSMLLSNRSLSQRLCSVLPCSTDQHSMHRMPANLTHIYNQTVVEPTSGSYQLQAPSDDRRLCY